MAAAQDVSRWERESDLTYRFRFTCLTPSGFQPGFRYCKKTTLNLIPVVSN